MAARRRRPSRPSRAKGGSGARARGAEWIGGRLLPPFFITDREEPYRPWLVVWMELPTGVVVGQDVTAPEDGPGAVASTLLEAMTAPIQGAPRRPARIRVADPATADEVRAAVGPDIPIKIAPTPELDELLQLMVESMAEEDEDEDASYLEQGRVPAAIVADLFAAASILYRVAPWRVAADSQVLRLDIPGLGVEGACVSIIGALGQSLGLLVFPSLAGFQAFVRAAEQRPPARGPFDLGTGWLSLDFERGADLPAAMRKEVARHGWPVAEASAYPRVQRRERDGASRPLVERDVLIAAACATSLSAFFVKHRALFESDELRPVCESYFDEHDLEVRFTIPYEAYPLFDLDDTTPPR